MRYKSSYWLKFGFTPKPLDYEKKQMEVVEKQVGRNIAFPAYVINSEYGSYYKFKPYSLVIGKRATTTESGFRDNKSEIKERLTIICMGSSSTFGLYVNDYETYPHYLSADYNVRNCGIMNYRIPEVKALFFNEILKQKPDIVIINNTFNNLQFSSETTQKTKLFLWKVHFLLMEKSLFYLTLREKFHKGRGDDLYKNSAIEIRNNFLNSSFENFREDLQEIADACYDNNIKLYLLEEPLWFNGYSVMLKKEMREVYDKFHNIKVKHAKWIRSQEIFDNLQSREYFFPDGVHLTEKGNKKVAELILENL